MKQRSAKTFHSANPNISLVKIRQRYYNAIDNSEDREALFDSLADIPDMMASLQEHEANTKRLERALAKFIGDTDHSISVRLRKKEKNTTGFLIEDWEMPEGNELGF